MEENQPCIKQPDIVTLKGKINPNTYCMLHFYFGNQQA